MTAQQIRDLLKTRAHFRRAGYPVCHPAIVTIQGIVEEYRAQVGTPTYLSQMLGPLATLPVSEARFYGPNDEEMEFQGSERILDMLRVVHKGRLPWVVEAKGMRRYL